MLRSGFGTGLIEAGCDEAGRGCLAGPVFAAAVILPDDYANPELNDSKQLSERQRLSLRDIILRDAIDWSVASVDNREIDRINILHASFKAMHLAIENLKVKPGALLIDGNRFQSYGNIPHHCIVKGDSLYLSIAAASILAKTCRDDYMTDLAKEYPQYQWQTNKGYPTLKHREAILRYGITPYHRMSFSMQLSLF